MPTKIRLQRHGKKRYAYFHVVVADARAPRDGKYIEKLGTYNPNDNPATIDINFDRSLHWIKTGAQPTDTCRALLSYKGVIHKNHLDKGVLKGAHTQEEADKKFEAWLKEKENKVNNKIDSLAKATADAEKARLTAEKEANAKKAAEVLAKATPPVEETEAPTEENTPDTPTEATEQVDTTAETAAEVKEEVSETAKEEPIAEEKETAKEEATPAVEEVKEEPVAEVKEEEPSEEAKEEPVAEETEEKTKDEA